MAKFKKKPTIREIAGIQIELNRRLNGVMNLLSELEKAFGLYVEMNKDVDKFSKYIEKKIKEMKEMQNDATGNEESDKQNIQKDSDDKGSRTKRVRKKK
tara:strand:+ start:4706 stop:5002 length:297 start_codon:yes stop_codon:yes gene_type:complete